MNKTIVVFIINKNMIYKNIFDCRRLLNVFDKL